MITVLSIIIGILSIGLTMTLIGIRNLLYKNDSLEETIQIYSNEIEKIEEETIKYHRYFLELFTQTYTELTRIDKRGSFSSDDEVGFAFRVVMTSIESVKNKLSLIKGEEESDPEKR